MNVIYETEFVAECPADATRDIYRIVITTCDKWIPVEEILDAIEFVTRAPRYQEEITELLSQRFGVDVTVKTSGIHSGIRTEVI